MPKIHIEAHLPLDKLLSAIEQLDDAELEQFVLNVNALVARRKAPKLSQPEAELLRKINEGVPRDVQARYDSLLSKWQAETLHEDEYAELLNLTRQVEKIEAERLANLAKLARLRGTSLPALMSSLGITSSIYG